MIDLSESQTARNIEDLKWASVLEFVSVGTGQFFKTSNGRVKEETVGKHVVHTAGAGNIELGEWCRLMEEAVRREGKTELLDRIVEHCKTMAWLHSDSEIRQHALKCLSSKAYTSWEDFDEKSEGVKADGR